LRTSVIAPCNAAKFLLKL